MSTQPGAEEPTRPGQWVLHVDMDQFIAAVEVLRRPELAGLPVVVGGRGDPTERGVVATASYEARSFGVGSGMPLRTAAKRCPDAVFLPVDKPAYDAASAGVMAVLRATGLPVQVLGWDEAFVGLGRDVAPTADDAEACARSLQAAVLEATSLHCSIGIGDTTLQAKTATELGKPRGVGRLSDETWLPEMGAEPTSALWGIGRKTAARLEGLGIRTVAELAATPAERLAAEIGPSNGPWLRRLGRGAGARYVDPTPWVAKAHGRETTFQADVSERAALEEALRDLARLVGADLAAEGRPAVRVGIKVRLRPFTTVSRSLTLPGPTTDAAAIGDAAVALLARVDVDRPVRLLGVRAEMPDPAPADPATPG